MSLRPVIRAVAAVTLLGAIACSPDAASQKRQFRALAEERAANGDVAGAVQAWRNVVGLDDKDGDARLALGRGYAALGLGPQALAELVRAADLLPGNVAVQVEAGRMLLAAGRFEDAAGRARRALDVDLRNADALMVLGYASAKLPDSSAALAAVRDAAESSPADPRLQAALATLYQGKGDLVAAESAFRNAVTVAPASPAVRTALANFFLAIGRPADAEQVLTDALTVEDSSLTITKALVGVYLGLGRDADAEPLLSKVVASTTLPEYRIALGDIYVRRRDYARAITVYQPLVDDASVGPSALARIASAEHASGRAAAAYGRLGAGIAAHPRHLDLLATRARLFLQDRRFADAEREARLVLAIDPTRYEGLYSLGAALIELGRSAEAVQVMTQAAAARPRASLPKTQLGRLALARGEATMASKFADEAVRLEPSSAFARLLLVRAAIAERRATRASDALAPLLRELPTSPDVHVLAGDVAMLTRDLVKARASYQRALTLDPESDEGMRGVVRVAFASKRPGDAVALVTSRIDAGTKNTNLLFLGAQTLAAAGDTKGAEGLYQRIISVAPDRIDAYVNLAQIYVQQHRLDEGLAQYQAVAAKRPEAVEARTFIGVVQQLQGKPRDAQATYEALLQTTPDAPVAANNLAMLLLEGDGNVDVALNHAQTAKRLLPNDPDVSDTLGLVYLKKGLAAQAVQMFSFATQTQPARADFWLHLGQARAQTGSTDGAREALQKSMTLNPTGPGAEQARSLLAKLSK